MWAKTWSEQTKTVCLLYIMIGSSNDQAMHHHTPVGQTCSWQHWSFKRIFGGFALMVMIAIMVAIMSGTQRPPGIPLLVHGLVVQKIQIIKFPIWTKKDPTYHLGRLSSSKSYSNQHITTIITSIYEVFDHDTQTSYHLILAICAQELMWRSSESHCSAASIHPNSSVSQKNT